MPRELEDSPIVKAHGARARRHAVSSLRAARALVEESLAADHPLRVEIERDIATLTATTPYR